MQLITSDFVKNKRVLLRLDIDVPLGKVEAHHVSSDHEEHEHSALHKSLHVLEDFRLCAGVPTLQLCLEHAKEVIVMGHIGRPGGKEDSDLSVGPIVEWFEENLNFEWEDEKLKVLENLRFEEGEEEADINFAKQLAELGDVYVNEAFASYRTAASTTVLPALLPHAAGLNFAEEVEELSRVIHHPKKPLIAVMGGAKVEDKLPVIEAMSKIANHVLVGGKLPIEIREKKIKLPPNVLVAMLNEQGDDISKGSLDLWKGIIARAQMVVWNGPMGKIDLGAIIKGEELGSSEGTYQLAQMLIDSKVETIIGGGDTVSTLDQMGLLKQFDFVSTGGGAMLKLLADGTLPTIEALK